MQVIQNLCKRLNIPFPLPLGQDAVLTGSFMWHVLTADENTTWTPHDLDIFCTRAAVPRLRKYLIFNGFKLCFIKKFVYTPDSTNIVEEWVVPTAPDWPLTARNASDAFRKREEAREFFANICREYGLPALPDHIGLGQRETSTTKTGDMRIQLVIADSEKITDAATMIQGRFDFPTLENWFDGEKITVSHPVDVARRTSTVRERKNPDGVPDAVVYSRLQDRIDKYAHSYGLTIRIDDNLAYKCVEAQDRRDKQEKECAHLREQYQQEKGFQEKIDLLRTKIEEMVTALSKFQMVFESDNKIEAKMVLLDRINATDNKILKVEGDIRLSGTFAGRELERQMLKEQRERLVKFYDSL